MRIVKHFIALMIVIIIGVAIVIPILSKVTEDTTIIHSLPQTATTVISIIPVIIAIPLFMIVLGMFTGGSDGESLEEVEEEPEPEPIAVKRKDAVRILMERYANGEITSEEYTERISRL
jgi:uncharacterized membrane protein